MRICLIDFSGIFRRHWHATEHEEIGEAFRRTLMDVQKYGSGFDHTGVCIDCPPYKRSKIDPNYKAHREKQSTVMHEQANAIIERLREDGWHVLGADGYEADDIIATCCEYFTQGEDNEITVYSADKDLMQLVDDAHGVCTISTATLQKYDEQAVSNKFGILPHLVSDMLALTGDSSDGIPGIKGVGDKTAAKWLNQHGGLDGVLANADKLPERFAQIVADSKERIGQSWQLAQLMTDAPIDPAAILEPMQPTEQEEEIEMPEEEQPLIAEPTLQAPERVDVMPVTMQTQAILPAPQRELALEPRDPGQAWGLAKMLYKSRLFGDFPNPEAILAIVMTGRTFGMDAVSSLRGFHYIKSKAAPSSQLLIGLVKRHPACEWFRLVTFDDKEATWETKRRDEPEPTRMTYTMQDANLAGLMSNDNWKKRPKTMLRWRSGVELARVVYPDVVSGLCTKDELEDGE